MEEYQNNLNPETETETTALRPKNNKLPLIIGIVIIFAAIIIFKLVYQSPFERAKNAAVQITGSISSGDDYFRIDTNEMDISPDKSTDEYTQYELVHRIANPTEQEDALEAIETVNEMLGFNDSLYSQMLSTSALMGRQSAETKKYRATWTYHPDKGLEVTYEKK